MKKSSKDFGESGGQQGGNEHKILSDEAGLGLQKALVNQKELLLHF